MHGDIISNSKTGSGPRRCEESTMRKYILTAIAAVFLAALGAIPASAGAHCERHPGDYLGIDGRCQPVGSNVPHAGRSAADGAYSHHRHHQDRAMRNHEYRHHHVMDADERQSVPIRRGGVSEENHHVLKNFVDRCYEQAAKRSAIHGIEVRPEHSGGIDSVAHCHIPAIVTEHGAI